MSQLYKIKKKIRSTCDFGKYLAAIDELIDYTHKLEKVAEAAKAYLIHVRDDKIPESILLGLSAAIEGLEDK